MTEVFSSYNVLIFLGVVVIMSYMFDIIAKITKIPSVLLLLGTGVGFRLTADYFGYQIPNVKYMLELFGTIGLILIVLEASIELKLSREKLGVIKKSLLAALVILIGTATVIAYIIHIWIDAPMHICFVNAIPLAVISSAVAIPSISNLTEAKKEFLIYEATFSDILGIMLFNFALADNPLSSDALIHFSTNLVLIIIISLVGGLLLMFFVERITHHVKFFLILAVLIMVYSLGKMIHLSSLLLVLAFGMIIGNTELFARGKLKKFFNESKLIAEAKQLNLITAESAFLIRTFFFILFGYSIALTTLTSLNVYIIGSLIILAILVIRFVYLKYVARTPLVPELFIAPRGLITILLFYNIPSHLMLEHVTEGILFFVVIITGLMMMGGLMASHDKVEDIPNY